LFFRNFFFSKLLNYDFFIYPFFNFLLGPSVLKRQDSFFIFDCLSSFLPWLGSSSSFHIISDYLGFLSFSEIGLFSKNFNVFFTDQRLVSNSFVFFLNVDFSNFSLKNCFALYQGFFESTADHNRKIFL